MRKHLQLVAFGIVTASFVACSSGDAEDGTPPDAGTSTPAPDAGSPKPVPTTPGPTVDAGANDAATVKDAQAQDASNTDAAAGPACDLAKPFGTPVLDTDLSTAQPEEGARVSPSGLELFLMREDTVGKRLYRYTRASTTAAWGNVELQLALVVTPPTAPASGYMTLDPTGLTGNFAVFTPGNVWQIHQSSRGSVGGAWTTPSPLPGVFTAGKTDEQPFLNASGKRLYFMSNRNGAYRIFVTTNTLGSYSTPALVGPLHPSEDRFPVLSPDELTLYSASYTGAATGMRIFKSTRATIGGSFAGPVEQTELNAGSLTVPTSISPDGCEIYLSSNRRGGMDIFRARKPK